MLVLRRNVGEKVIVYAPDGKVLGSVVLVSVGDDRAQIGIDLPKAFALHRPEIVKPDPREPAHA